MLHAGLIGVSGKAPGELEWRRPAVMETAAERHDRLEGALTKVPNVWHSGENGASLPLSDGQESAM